MAVLADTIEVSAIEMKIDSSEIHANSTYGAVPVLDQQDALEVFRAFDDGGLAELPQALAAYVDHQQHFAL